MAIDKSNSGNDLGLEFGRDCVKVDDTLHHPGTKSLRQDHQSRFPREHLQITRDLTAEI